MTDVRLQDAKELAAGYTRWHKALDVFSVVNFFALCIWIEERSIRADARHLLSVPAAIVTGLLMADLVSGLVHWAFDSWGSTNIPVVGTLFIRPFREHHVDPKSITRHDFFETNGNNCLSTLPIQLGALALDPSSAFQAFIATTVIFFVFFVGFTGQIHKFAHSDNPPRIIRWFQKRRIILSTDHHEWHHGAPFDRNYCITVGFWDKPLDRLGIYRMMERAITKVTGVVPRTDDIGETAATQLVARDELDDEAREASIASNSRKTAA